MSEKIHLSRDAAAEKGCLDGGQLHKLFMSETVHGYRSPIWVRPGSFNVCGWRHGIWTTLQRRGENIV